MKASIGVSGAGTASYPDDPVIFVSSPAVNIQHSEPWYRRLGQQHTIIHNIG